MGYPIAISNLPIIGDYAAAKRKYNDITPIRGSNNLRPLGGRRAQHMRIEERYKNGMHGLACVLYNTDCVTYWEDGTVQLDHGGYISQSTMKFIWRVHRPALAAYGDSPRGCMVVRLRHKNDDYGTYLLNFTLTIGADGVPTNADPCVMEQVDRKAMNALRKRCADFLNYARGMGRLTEWSSQQVMTSHSRGISKLDAEAIFDGMAGDDHERWYAAYLDLCDAAGRTDWLRVNGGFGYHTYCTEGMFMRHVKRCMIEANRDTVVRTETLPLGQYKKQSKLW